MGENEQAEKTNQLGLTGKPGKAKSYLKANREKRRKEFDMKAERKDSGGHRIRRKIWLNDYTFGGGGTQKPRNITKENYL